MKLRQEMESLWKETFRDSDSYIKLVFDRYFSSSFVAYREHEGKLLASLLSIPYDFSSSLGVRLKGWYLCGLATRPEFRRRGIMGQLLEEINGKAKTQGADFTFLIPENDTLREYYKTRGYHDSFYRLHENYVKGHEFNASEDIDVIEVQESLSGTYREKLIEFLIGNQEERFPGKYVFKLQHNRTDWEAVLMDAVMSEQRVFLAEKEKKIVAVGFTGHVTSESIGKRSIVLNKVEAQDEEAEEGLLRGVERLHPDKNIVITRNLDDVLTQRPGEQLWRPFFAKNNSLTEEYEDVAESEQQFDPMLNAFSFGMVRILDIQGLLAKLGGNDKDVLKGYDSSELIRLLLRRPCLQGKEDPLTKLLELPVLSLNAALLLE